MRHVEEIVVVAYSIRRVRVLAGDRRGSESASKSATARASRSYRREPELSGCVTGV